MASAVSILEKHRVFQDEKGRRSRQAMIEFAQYHVTQALIQASSKAKMDFKTESETIVDNEFSFRDSNYEWICTSVNKDSILDSYPLENVQ